MYSLLSNAISNGVPNIPLENYRNFAIVAHIDHGKSTLSDRLLEYTGTIRKDADNKQVLDKLKVEQERGITVKAQTCTMFYQHKGQDYLINLIDTPGHVDFRAEVSRSLAACNGALLLVDAAQGIQAQTVANFYLAFAEGLEMLPALNKIDLPSADPERVLTQMRDTFEIDTSDALMVSAKAGLGIETVLPAVIERMPPPSGDAAGRLKCLLIDSWYDNYVGVIALIRVFDGTMRKGDKITSAYTGLKYEVGEVGIMHPDRTPIKELKAGMVGYIITGMKESKEAHIGDTYMKVGEKVDPLPGFEPTQPMVFVGAYPIDAVDFTKLDESISHLVLNDRSVSIQKETSTALGQGWRIGFLGTLHCSVFQDRLKQEYGSEVIITAPTVPFKVRYQDGSEAIISNPYDFPDLTTRSGPNPVEDVQEPIVEATMMFPQEYLGPIIELCEANRGEQKECTFMNTGERVLLKYALPLSQLVDDFFGKLKGMSKGYASLDYEDSGYRTADLVKLTLLVNKKPVDALAAVCHRSQVDRKGREWAKRLKNLLDRQLYEIIIQATVGQRVIARESISAMRKDVTAKCYGGDITRKMKLLSKQKEGKKRMKTIGNIQVDPRKLSDFLTNKDV
ncbi:GTP-binding protein lepa [Saitoella complicata NRRL Y-17804]|uniref:GTP-binding protein lepa n=1 Tax=Saitoella complicata (strain BCRC 22490 / CBS 7301 / JCM 7358 / NBRC 10748 / NRRL Y-17804) TaxID=698492 RepID=UPI0008678D7A|nr:GTP-binding protein lepa [Saitoella complicata NRRL Y-17804]ODQ50303.1 GTP-binding protein lepa [Saitoella complicata NRRL Y-17804]